MAGGRLLGCASHSRERSRTASCARPASANVYSHADADELAGNVAAEGPEGIAHAVGEPPFTLPHFKMHNQLSSHGPDGSAAGHSARRRDRILLANNGIVQIVFAGGRVGGPREQGRRQRRAFPK